MNLDTDKIRSAAKGNKQAFYQLIHTKEEEIYKIAYLYTKQRQDSLDIFQDTVCHALKSIKTLKDPLYFDTWLIRITINCCNAHVKRKKRITENELLLLDEYEFDPADNETDVFENLSAKLDLLNAIDQLDVHSKTIVILRFYKDLPLSRIAEILSCPLSTVKTRLYRALAALKKLLPEYESHAEGGVPR